MGQIITSDALEGLKSLPEGIADMCVTSPPYYGLRDYGVDGQIGLEETPEAYIERLVQVFREVRRVLKDDGILWIVIGDSYNGSGKAKGANLDGCLQETNKHAQQTKTTNIKGLKSKDMIGIPWELAFALRADGWWLRQDIIWSKPNPMPESVTDRCTKSHEYIFLLSKSRQYYFDHKIIMEPATYDGRKDTRMKGSHKYSQEGVTGLPVQTFAARGLERWQKDDEGNYLRNKRSVWTINTKPFFGVHFAVFPSNLVRPCIQAGSREGGIVLDPFFGSGTTGEVAIEEGRDYIGIELNPAYVVLAEKRLANCERQMMLPISKKQTV